MKELKKEAFIYELPEEFIAQKPKTQRDASNLLVYKNHHIYHYKFDQLTDHLSAGDLLVFNNTKVIPARVVLYKETGARIELFFMEPIAPFTTIEEAMGAQSTATWKCLIGNLKKWKDDQSLEQTVQIEGHSVTVKFTLTDRTKQEVTLKWSTPHTMAKLIHALGTTPIPPYIKRKACEIDKQAYQTVYAIKDGAVAAPTAGLHFTEKILNTLPSKGINTAEVTLHVGAGTFQPLTVENVMEHPMHQEEFLVTKPCIQALLDTVQKIIAVGTTSSRTLESLYWFGLMLGKDATVDRCFIPKSFPYTDHPRISKKEALTNVQQYMEENDLETLHGVTEIMIVPSYKYRVIDGLITNFHLPESTLIMLVAALVGDQWKTIYEEAKKHNYRFLSYGDSSLLFPKE